MSLSDLLWKDPIISTVGTDEIVANPEDCRARYGKHLATYVSLSDVTAKWTRLLNRLGNGRSAMGSIYAPIGFGKTGAALDLWALAEKQGFLAVPPFVCASLQDILAASHAWIVYTVTKTHKDKSLRLAELYEETRARSDEEWIAGIQMDFGFSEDQARGVLRNLRANGNWRPDVAPSGVLRYLREATDIAVQCGYRGLLIIPDEFKLFVQTSSDRDVSMSALQQFIWGIIDEHRPIGIVFSMPDTTYLEIKLKAEDILQRLGASQVNVNLHEIYREDFPRTLWERLGESLELNPDERSCIEDEVFQSLGQFCVRTDLFDGPRSVIATFKQAAFKYRETGRPYGILDFVEHYLSGAVVFDSKESSAKGATASMESLHRDEGSKSLVAIRLLAGFPDGCPNSVSCRLGVESELERISRQHLGERVVYQTVGPSLRVYKRGGEADPVTETLRAFQRQYNPSGGSTRRAALRAFWNIILPKMFRKRQGTAVVGWTGLKEVPPGGLFDFHECQLVGAPSERFPHRRVHLRVTVDDKYWHTRVGDAHAAVSLFLDGSDGAAESVEVVERVVLIRLPLSRVIDTVQIPGDIARLKDIFLPRDVTPGLLLAVSDFLYEQIIHSDAQPINAKKQVEYTVGNTFAERIVRELFGEALQLKFPHEVPAGGLFVESVLDQVFRETYPSYVPLLGIPPQIIDRYVSALSTTAPLILTLAQKRGHVVVQASKDEVARQFGYSSNISFRDNARTLLSGLITVDEWEGARQESSARIRLKQHPLEDQILDWLRGATTHITVESSAEVPALTIASLLDKAGNLGYLEDEVHHVIRLLVARGYCEKREVKGNAILNLLISGRTASDLTGKATELTRDLEDIKAMGYEERDVLPEDLGVSILPSVEELRLREARGEDIQEDLDELQHRLDRISDRIRQFCATRIALLLRDRAMVYYDGVQAARSKPVPTILDPAKKPVPVTDYATLMQSLQVQLSNSFLRLKSEYSAVIDDIEKVRKWYEEQKSPGTNLVRFLQEMTKRVGPIEERVASLDERSVSLGEMISSYQRWHDLSVQVSEFVVTLLQHKAGNSLAGELHEEMRKGVLFEIQQNFATRKLEALFDWEIFSGRVRVYLDRWERAATEKRREYMERVDRYRALLNLGGLTSVEIDPSYDPAAPQENYRRLSEQVMRLLDEARNKIRFHLDDIKTELLKMERIYTVTSVTSSPQLVDEWQALESEVKEVFSSLTLDVVADLSQFERWLEGLKPIIEPDGRLVSLKEKVEAAILGVRHVPLSKEELEVLQVMKASGNSLTQVFTAVLRSNSNLSSVEMIMRIVLELYRKGRVNLEATVIFSDDLC